MPIAGETMERNHIGTMDRNYKRNPKPEYNEPKMAADVQPISKDPNPTVNKREDKESSSPASEEPPTPNPERTSLCHSQMGGLDDP